MATQGNSVSGLYSISDHVSFTSQHLTYALLLNLPHYTEREGLGDFSSKKLVTLLTSLRRELASSKDQFMTYSEIINDLLEKRSVLVNDALSIVDSLIALRDSTK